MAVSGSASAHPALSLPDEAAGPPFLKRWQNRKAATGSVDNG